MCIMNAFILYNFQFCDAVYHHRNIYGARYQWANILNELPNAFKTVKDINDLKNSIRKMTPTCNCACTSCMLCIIRTL